MSGTSATSPQRRFRRGRLAEVAAALLILLIGAAVIASAFERLPIEGTSLAIDWQGIYKSIQGGPIIYRNGGLILTPWAAPLIAPLGLLSMRASWGVLSFFTLLIEIVSVPNRAGKGIRLLSILLLVVSGPSLRHIADGNFEGLVIAGVALTVYAIRKRDLPLLVGGILIATAKPQETWIFLIGVAFLVLTTWSVQRWLKAGLIIAVVASLAFLVWGGAWLSAVTNMQPPPGALNDMSLKAAVGRLGLPLPVFVIGAVFLLVATGYVMLRSDRTLSREKAAMLVCVSLLLAPYAAGNSFLTVLAIGIIPLFQVRRGLGIVLIVLTDLILFLPKDFQYYDGAYYWTAMLIAVWVIMARTVLATSRLSVRA